MIIRFAKLSDAAFIIQAQMDMAFESEGLQLDRSTVTKGVQAVLNDASKGQYLLAYDDNHNPLGCLLLLFEWSDWRNRNIYWIHSLYVMPEARQRGVYKKMYHFLQEEVRRRDDLGGIRLYVDKRNLAAQAVYRKLGMDGEHYQLFEWLK